MVDMTLVKYTNTTIRKFEIIASAKQIAREVRIWLTSNAEATNFVRIAELRAIQNVGSEYADKLRSISAQIAIQGLNELRHELASRLEEIKKALKKAKKRAEKLWQTNLNTINDAEILQIEVDELFSVFEGCEIDLEDLQIMRKSLRIYIQSFKQLSNDRLTSTEFETLANKIKEEVLITLGEDDPPWKPVETIENFRILINKNRTDKSSEWIRDLESRVVDLESLNASEINSLHARTNSPPAFLAEDHCARLEEIYKNIEKQISKIKIDWLIEKYKELAPEMQRLFLARIST